jgi:hypothetical protein
MGSAKADDTFIERSAAFQNTTWGREFGFNDSPKVVAITDVLAQRVID